MSVSSPVQPSPLTRFEKFRQIVLHSQLNVWSWPDGRALPYQFWVVGDATAAGQTGFSYSTFETFVDAAYARIDPLTTTTVAAMKP